MVWRYLEWSEYNGNGTSPTLGGGKKKHMVVMY